MNEKLNEMFDSISAEEKSVLVVKFLKSISKWDLKRILCNVLDVDNHMDDEGLAKEFYKVLNER